MALLFALASALFYGAADFMGGLAARSASTVAIVALSQCAGLVLLALVLPFVEADPRQADLLWGAAAGVSGGTGVALLYRALAIGTMGVVAPTTAICAVALPVVAGVLMGERPGATVAVGIAVALVAIVLVGQQAGERQPAVAPSPQRSLPSGFGLALLSGVAIAVFYLSLAQTGANAGLWPLFAARLVSVTMFGAVAAAGAGLRLPRRVGGLAIGGGVLDMAANAFYLVAVRQGPLTVVVTLASLYPASTVVLARAFLGERLSRMQAIGVVLALAAVALIVG